MNGSVQELKIIILQLNNQMLMAQPLQTENQQI